MANITFFSCAIFFLHIFDSVHIWTTILCIHGMLTKHYICGRLRLEYGTTQFIFASYLRWGRLVATCSVVTLVDAWASITCWWAKPSSLPLVYDFWARRPFNAGVPLAYRATCPRFMAGSPIKNPFSAWDVRSEVFSCVFHQRFFGDRVNRIRAPPRYAFT